MEGGCRSLAFAAGFKGENKEWKKDRRGWGGVCSYYVEVRCDACCRCRFFVIFWEIMNIWISVIKMLNSVT